MAVGYNGCVWEPQSQNSTVHAPASQAVFRHHQHNLGSPHDRCCFRLVEGVLGALSQRPLPRSLRILPCRPHGSSDHDVGLPYEDWRRKSPASCGTIYGSRSLLLSARVHVPKASRRNSDSRLAASKSKGPDLCGSQARGYPAAFAVSGQPVAIKGRKKPVCKLRKLSSKLVI